VQSASSVPVSSSSSIRRARLAAAALITSM
jgi:hypothetical protein